MISLQFIKHIITSYNASRAPRRRSGVWFMNTLIVFNEAVKLIHKSQQMIHSQIEMIRSQLFWSRQLTDSNEPFRASQWTELIRTGRSREHAHNWCCEKYVTNVEF